MDKNRPNKYHYCCKTCGCSFDAGKPWKDGVGSTYERCPRCESWNYGLTNLSVKKLEDGLFYVDYNSPSVGMTLFTTRDESEASRVYNRFWNLSWSLFNAIVMTGNVQEQARLYLEGAVCLMRDSHGQKATHYC